MDTVWKLCLLGDLSVEGGDRKITRFRTQKTAALLAYLGYHPDRTHAREFLTEILWPDDEPDAARHKLRVALTSLRHQLEPPGVPAGAVIAAGRGWVRLNAAACTTDVAEFEREIHRAEQTTKSVERAQLFGEAVQRYRGELLPGHYEEWIFPERARLAERYRRALGALIALLEADRHYDRALDYARRAVAAAPEREETHRDLIRLLVATGQHAPALQQYTDLERILHDALGTAPSAATRALINLAALTRPGAGASTRSNATDGLTIPVPAAVAGPTALSGGTFTFLLIALEAPEGPSRAEGIPAAATALVTGELERRGGALLKVAPGPIVGAFGRAAEALTCGIAIQSMLATSAEAAAAEPDAGGVGACARVALHTGNLPPEAHPLSGPGLEQGTAMLLAAHAGQILCSEETAALARRHLDPGVRLEDLGSFRLRGIEPPERLFQATYPAMQARDFPPLRAEGGHSFRLPPTFTRFFGREEELAKLAALLLDEETRLVTLTGPGGGGKTRLAQEGVRRIVTALRVSVWFIPLAPLLDAGWLYETIRDAMQLARIPDAEPLDQVVEALTRQPALLVLDSFEHLVAEGALLLRQLQARVPALKCVVTSRRRLDLGGEQEFPVGPLPTPTESVKCSVSSVEADPGPSTLNTQHLTLNTQPLTPQALMACPSVQLFVDRAQAVRPDFQVTTENVGALARLCDRLEGIPLALELAAARASVLTPAQMLAQLGQRFELLMSRRGTEDDRHRSLHATITWSYQGLPPDLRRVFAQLAVFRNGWTSEAAAAVCAEPAMSHALLQLRSCSLIAVEEAGDAVRCRMLDTLREYAWEQLAARGEAEAACRRHAEHFFAWIAGAATGQGGAEAGRWRDALERDHDNLRAALAWALNEEPAVGLGAATRLVPFWEARGHWAEGRRWLRRYLELEPGSFLDQARAEALFAAGTFAWHQSDHWEAQERIEAALRLSTQLPDRVAVAQGLRILANIAERDGGYARGRPFVEASLLVFRELDDQGAIGGALMWLARNAEYEADHLQAVRFAEEALTIYRQRDDPVEIAAALQQIGNAARSLGDLTRANTCFEEQLALLRGLDRRGSYVAALPRLGNLTLHQGDYTRARELFEEQLAFARDSGDTAGLMMALWYVAQAARCQGECERAVAVLEERLQLCREAGSDDGVAGSLFNLGEVARARGEYALAKARIAESVAVFAKMQDRSGLAWCLEGLGKVACEEREYDRTARLFGASSAAFQTGCPPGRLPLDSADYVRAVTAARAALGEVAFDAAWAAGSALLCEQAIQELAP